MSILPRRKRGKQSAAAIAKFEAEKREFCDTILQISSTLDFKVSARGWGYIFENRGLITKAEFDACQRFINDRRKSGELPIDICAVDDSRAFSGVEWIDRHSTSYEAWLIVEQIKEAHLNYHHISLWDNQTFYVQMMVEKIDLRSLFEPICREFNIPIANAKGWSDINSRAAMMERFKDAEMKGLVPVLLYCGDHDPAGLNISEFMRSNMNDLSHAVGWSPDNLVIDRFGLNPDFIEAHNLTWVENLITGSGEDLANPKHDDHSKPYVQRYIQQFGIRKVEANALVIAPDAGRALCRNAIMKYVNVDAIREYRLKLDFAQEEVRMEVVRILADEMAGGAA
ncbi:MAG: hypothetical protein M9932_01575 [Xanthobacteraceae bacterium]|nr:hypothetical protein [Xanthobacteraceae bacterium]